MLKPNNLPTIRKAIRYLCKCYYVSNFTITLKNRKTTKLKFPELPLTPQKERFTKTKIKKKVVKS